MGKKGGLKSFLKHAFLGVDDRRGNPQNHFRDLNMGKKGGLKSFLKHAFLGVDDRRERRQGKCGIGG